MKKNNLCIYLSEVCLLIYIIMFKTIVSKYFVSYIDVFNIVFWGILGIVVYKVLGLPKKNSLMNYSGLQVIIICMIGYYFLTYLFGLFYGFLSSAYSLNFLNILSNMVPVLIVYILREIYRYIIVQKTRKKNYFPLILATLLIAVLDIIMEINGYDLRSGAGIFEFLEASVLPNLALSALLSYISYKFNYKLGIIFLIMFDLPKYFLPIFPDMGTYFGSMVNLVFVFVCYYRLSLLIEKYECRIPVTVSRVGKNYFVFPVIVLVLVLVGLISGVFKYHLFAIGSNSMLKYIAKGDGVLIEKLNEDEYQTIEVGDVLAVNHNNQIIVHRVVSIDCNNGVYSIRTKGDNNDSVDAWIVRNDDIYGMVKYVIKYIGLPSVELSELMNEKW